MDAFCSSSFNGIMAEQEEDIGSYTSFEEEEEEEEDEETAEGSSEEVGSLFQMSSLLGHLPLKRGLSKYFEGKSQSFSSLCNVRSLEDLEKPERRRPCKKRLKSSKSYGGGLDSHRSLFFTKAAVAAKKPSSLGSKKRRPPFRPQQRSSANLSCHDAILSV